MTPDPFLDLSGLRILVSGSAGGIGSATAKAVVARGASVLCIDFQRAEVVADRVGSLENVIDWVEIDTSDRSAVERCVERYGPFDALVDAAAIYGGDDWYADGWDEDFDRLIDCNIKGPLNLCRAVWPGMIEMGGGRIVLVGSVAGLMGGLRSGPGYAFSKGGLHAFSKWLAHRGLSRNICVNVIAPGPVETPMVSGRGYDPLELPFGRLAQPDEIAAMALYLLGSGAAYMTGATIDITGGSYIR